MILSINNNGGDADRYGVFSNMNVTLIIDSDSSDGYYNTYELDYNNKELQIGSVKFYRVR